MRTYVSGLGSDANPGEIYVLDSANYGAVTINEKVEAL
jgi:hypothetical protein